MKYYEIQFTDEAKMRLLKLEKPTQQAILRKIKLLETEPEKRGKALQGILSGLRSIRAAGQRYRIIYKIESEKIVVIVIAIGIRKEGGKEDIYSQISQKFK